MIWWHSRPAVRKLPASGSAFFIFRRDSSAGLPLVAIGSSLSVYPVAAAVPLARSPGARVIVLNAQPHAHGPLADLVLRSAIGEALPEMVKGVMRDR